MTSVNTGRRARLASSAALSATLAAAAAQPASAHPHVFVSNEAAIIFENGALSGLRYTWLFDEMYTASATEGLDKNNDGKLDAAELEELTKVNIEGLKEFDYFTTATTAGQPVQFGDAKDYSMELKTVDEPPGPQMVAAPSTGAASPAEPQSQPRGLWSRITGWWSGLLGRSPPVASVPSAGTMDQARTETTKAKVLSLTMTLPLKSPLAPGALTSDGKGFQFTISDPQMFIWFEPAGKDAFRLSADAPKECRQAFVEPELSEEQKKLAEAFGRLGSGIMGSSKTVGVMCGR